MTPYLDALSNACPKSFRVQLQETRNLLAAHRDERVLYRRLTGEHTPRAIKAYLRLGIEVPEGSMDSEIIAYGSPPGASDEEAAREPPASARSAAGSPTWERSRSVWGNWTKPSVHCARTSSQRNADRRLHHAGLADPLPVSGRCFLTTARPVDLRAAGRAARRPRLELQPLGAGWTRGTPHRFLRATLLLNGPTVVHGRVSLDGTRPHSQSSASPTA